MKNINRTLQERIKDNALYFRGMEMTNGILIIKVQFEEKWGVYPNQAETIKVILRRHHPGILIQIALAQQVGKADDGGHRCL